MYAFPSWSLFAVFGAQSDLIPTASLKSYRYWYLKQLFISDFYVRGHSALKIHFFPTPRVGSVQTSLLVQYSSKVPHWHIFCGLFEIAVRTDSSHTIGVEFGSRVIEVGGTNALRFLALLEPQYVLNLWGNCRQKREITDLGYSWVLFISSTQIFAIFF